MWGLGLKLASYHFIISSKASHKASLKPQAGNIDSFNGRNFKVILQVVVDTQVERIGAIAAVSLAHLQWLKDTLVRLEPLGRWYENWIQWLHKNLTSMWTWWSHNFVGAQDFVLPVIQGLLHCAWYNVGYLLLEKITVKLTLAVDKFRALNLEIKYIWTTFQTSLPLIRQEKWEWDLMKLSLHILECP